jgi:hypothetical protein
MKQQWEYKVIHLPWGTEPAEVLAKKQALLTQLGADGWELVALDDKGTAFFKRPK